MVKAIVTAVTVAFAMSGCVQFESETVLYDDDTYSQHIVAAVDESLAASAPSDEQPDIDIVTGLSALTDAEGVTVTDYASGDLTGLEVAVDRRAISEASELSAGLTSVLGGDVSIERAGDTYIVTLSPPLELLAELDPGLVAQAGAGSSAVDVEVSFRFPGLVESANLGTVEGKTVTLDLADLLSGREIVIVGSANNEIYWTPIVRSAGVIAGFALIIGAAIVLVIQDRRRRAAVLPPPRDTSAEGGVGTLS